MAASRNNSTTRTSTDSPLAPRRISFAKISEPLEVPKLLDLQTKSFDWLVGNEAWNADVQQRLDNGEDVSLKSGLEEIFEEISPIEDFSGTMSRLSISNSSQAPRDGMTFAVKMSLSEVLSGVRSK